MYCIISMILLALWTVSGLERVDILAASIIFAILYIPENYTTQKFKHMEYTKEIKYSLNGLFGTANNRDNK